MNNIDSLAYDYTLKLGISPSLTGFHWFAQAVAAYASLPDFPPLEEICGNIGKQCSMQLNTVEHAISYALKKAPDLCNTLFKITGVKVLEEDIRPKYVICLIAQCVKRDLEELGLTQLDMGEPA